MRAYDNSPARSLLPLWIFLSMIIPPPIPVPTTTTAAFVAVLALPSHNSARAAHLPSFSRATDTPPHAFDMRSPRCAPSRYLIPPPPYTMPRSTSICPGSPMAIPVMSQSSTFSSYTFLICATNAGVPASAYLSVGVLPFPDILPSSSINAYFINVAPTSNTKYISPSCFFSLPLVFLYIFLYSPCHSRSLHSILPARKQLLSLFVIYLRRKSSADLPVTLDLIQTVIVANRKSRKICSA